MSLYRPSNKQSAEPIMRYCKKHKLSYFSTKYCPLCACETKKEASEG